MRTRQWREFTTDELKEKVHDKTALLFKRRFETHDDQAKNPGEVREARLDIARIRTILKERELGLSRGGVLAKSSRDKADKPESAKPADSAPEA